MKIEEKNVCKFRSILNTFCIDENLKKKNGGVCVSDHESQKKKSKSRFTEIKISIFGNFTNHGESIRNLNRRSRE